jgi:hypothetical protein
MPWLVRCCVDVVAVGCVEVVVDPCSLQEGKNAIATMAPSKTNMYLLFEFMVTFAIEGRRVSSFYAMEVSLHAPFRLIDRDLRVFARQGLTKRWS